MDIESLQHEVIVKNGRKYEFNKLENPLDLTEQNDDMKTEATHLLKGFDEDLLLIIEENDEESCFYFAHKVGDTGLIVNLEDRQVYDAAIELLMEVLERG